jgi:uncharacterized delta-60 repeat protein
MTFKHKVSGVWRDGVAPYVKVAGNWEIAKSAWRKIDGKWRSWFLQSGVLDNFASNEFVSSFNSNIGVAASNSAYDVAIQPDDKIILVGEFRNFNGTVVNRIVRLNADGTLDTAFTANTGTGADFEINAVDVQPDGKIVIGGGFQFFNGTFVGSIARLNTDGTLDTAFTTNTGSGFFGTIFDLKAQSNNQIVVCGDFFEFNSVVVNNLVRLNSSGTRDTTFSTNIGTGPNNQAFTLKIQTNGQILVGGIFTTFNGATVNRIVRLNSSGTRDTTFTTNTGTAFDDFVGSIETQADQKIIVGGSFSTFNGVTVNGIVRLNSTGTRDTVFTTNTGTGTGGGGSGVGNVTVFPDNKIALGEVLFFNDELVGAPLILNSDGTKDIDANNNIGNNVGDGIDNGIWGMVYQSETNGKIIAVGTFSNFSGNYSRGVVALNKDWSVESSNYYINGSIEVVKIQADQKIVVGGSFTTHNGVTSNRIARLNADGTRDTAFTTAIGTGFGTLEFFINPPLVLSIAVQEDQKIVVGGRFTTHNGVTSDNIARLNSDGTRDTAFTTAIGTGFNNRVATLAIQPDGKILVGGTFTTQNSLGSNRIARLNSDGTSDASFRTAIGTGFNSAVNAVALQADGKIVVGGIFSTFNGVTSNRIARLNSDGTRDTDFTTAIGTGFNNTVNAVALQADGKIVVGGTFTTHGGVTSNRIARLNADGTRDTAFTTAIGTGFGGLVDPSVTSLAIQPDGKIVVGGRFTTFNAVTVNNIVRLNSDGTRDTTFTNNTGVGTNGDINDIAIQDDKKILIGGFFTTFNGIYQPRIARIGGDIETV